MLDTLARLCQDGGRLVGVSCALFEGDPAFITAVAFQFEGVSAVFRAAPDDDTLAASVGDLSPEQGEVAVQAGGLSPWGGCIGRTVSWAWQLINQQGYADGVRLEFGEPGAAASVVVELVVIASGIRVFTLAEAR